MWRLANYDKQMRLGNVAVDNCISQGLPDFYFSLSLPHSLFSSFPVSFFLSPNLSTLPREPRSRLLVHCLSPYHGGGNAKTAVAWRRRRWRRRKKRLTQRLLFASFVIPPIFLAAADAAAAAFFLIALLLLRLLLFVFFFCFFMFSRAHFCTHPLTRTLGCNSAMAFQPLERQFIFIAMFRSRLFHPPFRASQLRSPLLSCRVLFIYVSLPQRSFHSSFFL